MELAHYQRMLSSSRGAAFGVMSIAKEASAAIEPHLPSLLPKLYRLQYDPNRGVNEAVTSIWRALLPEPRKAVDQYLDPIMKELLKEIGGTAVAISRGVRVGHGGPVARTTLG
jgi:proteasome component ECM29